DGHSTHMTYQLSDLCSQLKIVLICLYPNATRIFQPADVSAFKPIKSGWKKGVLEWRRSHINECLTKETFAPVLKNVIEMYSRDANIRNGFKACGLYPF